MELAKELNEPFTFLFSQKEKGDSSTGGSSTRGHGPSIGERLYNLKIQINDGAAMRAAQSERELRIGW